MVMCPVCKGEARELIKSSRPGYLRCEGCFGVFDENGKE